MKKLKSFIYLSILAFGLNSCDNELIESNSTQNINDEVTINNGRLSFQSKESFARVFKEFAEASDAKLFKYFQPLYEEGFYSLRPIVTESNEQFVYNHYIKLVKNNQLLKTSNNALENEDGPFDYLDDLEDIVGDDVFAAFLNNNAEILIDSKIYKYSDVGLFISAEDKYNILQEYLDSKNISNEIEVTTSEYAKNLFYDEIQCAGLNTTYQLTSDIEYFSQIHCNTGGSYGGVGSYNPTPGSPASTDPSYNAFLNNLSSCTPHSGLFGNLFGDNNVCIDKYENRRRVKTKAFNYNYLLVYHLGVKCVHQYKGWTGFWRVEATDEIRLVVEAAQFQYDLNALNGNTAINNQTKERAYFLNNQKILYTGPNNIIFGNPNNVWNAPTFSYLNQTSLPSIFKDDLSFEFFSTGWDFLDSLIQNGIDSNTKASKLNEWFYSGLYTEITGQIRTAINNSSYNPARNRTFVAKFPEQGKLIFQKSVVDQGFNSGTRSKTFDWGAEFSFNASATGNNGWSMSGGTGSVLVRPTNFRVKIIGAARRGSTWHGSKFNVGID